MFQGSSKRVRVPVRVSLFTLILPLVVALGLVLLGVPGARATQILTHGQLSLYGGPGSAFSVLATVAAGAKVEVLWCNAEATWCLVQNGAVEGWTPREGLVVKKGSDSGGAHSPSSALANGSPSNNAVSAGAAVNSTASAGASLNSAVSAGASIVSSAPQGGSTQPAASAGAVGTAGSISAGVSAAGAKLGVSVH